MHFDIDYFIWTHYVEIMLSIVPLVAIGKTIKDKINAWLEN